MLLTAPTPLLTSLTVIHIQVLQWALAILIGEKNIHFGDIKRLFACSKVCPTRISINEDEDPQKISQRRSSSKGLEDVLDEFGQNVCKKEETKSLKDGLYPQKALIKM